ncbi:AIPR family protein [Marinomonas shanghaiensis]|uniref:AIPR family protein n=1 Tax=Marinomonas shanghaiensis TaxID=2202418 RepID=UPI003A8D539E
MNTLEFELDCEDYRTLHIPNTGDSNAKLGTLFAKVEDIPDTLSGWTDVNPRTPKLNKSNNLSGAVARSIVRTLKEEPELFSLKNLGIYLLVDDVQSKRISGDRHHIKVTLNDKSQHGIVNGGHTYAAIMEALKKQEYSSGAYVRLHLYMNIPEENIVELAEGLNKNLQVDSASLSNLTNEFDTIKAAMKGVKGEKDIAYADGDQGDVDILEILHIMSCFDINFYKGAEKHPNDIFGSKQKILKRYLEDIKDKENSSYLKIISDLPNILRLSDEVQKVLAKQNPRVKIKNTEDKNRVSSAENYREAKFSDGVITGFVPQGWLYPALSSLRACLSSSEWEKGVIKWNMSPFDLLDDIKVKLGEIIQEQHNFNKNKPAEVGRKPTAYDQCYAAAFMALVMKGKIEIPAQSS